MSSLVCPMPHGPKVGRIREPMPTVDALWPELGQRTLVMGVLNVTPDSFSDGRPNDDADRAVARGVALVEAGADVVDVGGESTRPGAPAVSADDELARVLPVIEGLMAAGVERISIDTTKAIVARRAVEAGACIVNDISAMTFDPAMAETVAAAGAPIVLSHTRDRPEAMQLGDLTYEGGVVAAVHAALAAAVEAARSAGITSWMVDPGIGFGKTVEQNLELLRNLSAFEDLGPVLVGTSRKSFLGKITGRPVDQREDATAATVALSVSTGASMVRVHDVARMVDVVRVADRWCRLAPDSAG